MLRRRSISSRVLLGCIHSAVNAVGIIAMGVVSIAGSIFTTLTPIYAAAEDVNSIGQKMVEIPAGSFSMGQERSVDWKQRGLAWDEDPVHTVTISQPFAMAATEVTNAQYALFDPSHLSKHGPKYRTLGFGDKENDPVTFVSWKDAVEFCKWLSEKEGKPYRLPTEAEWEYACRAGTTTLYSSGASLAPEWKKNQSEPEARPKPVDTTVGHGPPNPWGLFDMHGNVEEWVADWYGPYQKELAVDPIGPESGSYKVTRGGSHSTPEYYLRSANRSGTLPDDKSWLIGFRVVRGDVPKTAGWVEPSPAPGDHVNQAPKKWIANPEACFEGPIPFLRLPTSPDVPFFKHNHSPALTWCPNGDLLVFWFSANSELGRELCVLGSRLADGASEWTPAYLVAKAPDRNMHGFSLMNWSGKLLFIEGINTADRHDNVALALQTSADNGATWTNPHMVHGNHMDNLQCASGSALILRNGNIILPFDGKGKPRNTRLLTSQNGGETWSELTEPKNRVSLQQGSTGGVIAGWHAGVVERDDGSLFAMGREAGMADGRMPISISTDHGASWTYSASVFPEIATSQRLLLLKLSEGPILLASFTDDFIGATKGAFPLRGITTTDAEGKPRRIFGLFTALSFDDGKTWQNIKPLSRSGPAKEYPTVRDSTFIMDSTHSSPNGYLAGTQTPDGMLHIVTSNLYFKTNLQWLRSPMPGATAEEQQKEAEEEKALEAGPQKPKTKRNVTDDELNFEAK